MMKLQFSIILGALTILATGFEQHDYMIVVNKFEMLWYNKEFIENPLVNFERYNATTQAANVSYTVLTDLGSNIWKSLELYAVKPTENQKVWSLHQTNLCDLVESNFMDVQDILKFGNVTKCPVKQGHYAVKNAVYDQSKLPMGAPRGQFYADVDVYSGSVHLTQYRVSFSVEDLPK